MKRSSRKLRGDILSICNQYNNDRSRLIDIIRDVQNKHCSIPEEAIDLIASTLNTHRVEIESVISFYSFLSKQQKGKFVIRICDDIIDRQHGTQRIIEEFEKLLKIKIGETTEDSRITLETTACIGMSDQAPAIIINETVITEVTPEKVNQLVASLHKTDNEKELITQYGEGNNANPLIKSMVKNNIRQKGEVIFSNFINGRPLKEALSLSPIEVIRQIKASGLRGRGGAGFPTGIKWEFTRNADGDKKTLICNADEGEPGTFKDRVMLTETSDLLLEGMTIGAYAIGANTGILYLRGEYSYLRNFLEYKLNQRRTAGLLGNNICNKKGFDFDIRIQMGAGAYVCGEETSLISSCEGLRGDPKNRPPFPAQKGYLGQPTCVNNVETFCCIPKIITKGAAWFSSIGTPNSKGTRIHSISGDCKYPGIYELPFGITLQELIDMAGAEDVTAIQIGGPQGALISPKLFSKKICYDALSPGGSIMIFNSTRNLFDIVHYFMDFFIDESCGFCTPCRVGNVLLQKILDKIISGKGEKSDIDSLESISKTVKTASRCGLGQTSPNPIISSLKNFREIYDNSIKCDDSGLNPAFDISQALKESEDITGRKSVIYTAE